MIDLATTILAIKSDAQVTINNEDINQITWHDDNPTGITNEQILAKQTELQNAEAMRLLREERNRRLAETDWWAMKEVDGWQMSPQQRVYRKNLRDMPETSPYPMLNENGELTNVDWPEKP